MKQNAHHNLRRNAVVISFRTARRLRNGVPDEIRTRVAAVKGRCPRPLDDGDVVSFLIYSEKKVNKINIIKIEFSQRISFSKDPF